MDFTSTSSSWIYGYKTGSSLNSNSVSAIITKHDKEGTFVLDLATATGGNSLNPFISSSSVTSGNSSSSTSVAAPGTGGSSNNAAEKNRDMMIAAHGIIGGIAFVILFPLGAIVLRVLNFPGLIWLHVCIQCVAYAASVAVFALGVVIALNEDEVMHLLFVIIYEIQKSDTILDNSCTPCPRHCCCRRAIFPTSPRRRAPSSL